MIRRMSTISLCAALLSLPLAGCGSEANSNNAPDSPPAASNANPDDWESKVIHSVGQVTTSSLGTTEKVEFPWGWISWLMNSEIDPQATMTYGIVRIEGGMSNPLHIHPNCEEYLYVMSGSCEHVLGDKTVTLKQGDVIRIPMNVPHKAKALGETPCDAVIVYNSGTREIILLEEGQE